MKKDYSYIKRSDISVLKATIDGKVLNVDPKDILSGSYVAKKVKSTAKKIRVAKIDSSKLRDKILNYAKKFYKKEYQEKLDPVYDSKVTTDDLDSFITCGLTEEMIMAFYCGFKSIMDIKSDGEFNYGFSGGIFTFQTEGGYIEKDIKRAIYNCENDVYELGFKYPTFNWKSAGMKMSKTEVIKSAEYEGWRNTKKQAILKIETFKVKTNFTVLAVKDIGEVVDGKTEARYGQNELLDPKKPLDLNNDYLALVSRNGKELFSLAKKLLSQTEGYVKDFDWLVQSKTFGAEMLTESKYKFAKGGLQKANAGAYIEMAEKVKEIAPKSVDSIDTKIANRVSKKSFAQRMSETGNEQYDNEQYSASNEFAKGGGIKKYLKIEGVKNYIDQKEELAKDLSSLNKDKKYYVIYNANIEAVEVIDQKFYDYFTGKKESVVGTKTFTILSIYLGGKRTPNNPSEYDKGGSTYTEGGEVGFFKIISEDTLNPYYLFQQYNNDDYVDDNVTLLNGTIDLKFKRQPKSETKPSNNLPYEVKRIIEEDFEYVSYGEMGSKKSMSLREGSWGDFYIEFKNLTLNELQEIVLPLSENVAERLEEKGIKGYGELGLNNYGQSIDIEVSEDSVKENDEYAEGGEIKTWKEGDKVMALMRGTKARGYQNAIITGIDKENGILTETDNPETLLGVYSKEEKLSDEIFAREIKSFPSSATKKEAKEKESSYAEGGKIYNVYILTSNNKMIFRRYPKKVTNKEIYQEYKKKGVEVKDTQIHFAKPIDFYETLRKETKKYIRKNMNDDVDIDNIFIGSKQKGNEYIATSIKGDTVSGSTFSITPKDLFEVKIKGKAYAEGGEVDFDPISYAKNAGKNAIDWMQELKNYAGENYDSLTAEEKDSIISELQMDYDFSHSFAKGGGLNDVRYIPIDAIEKVELKNGKIIENSFNEPIYSGLRVKGNKTADQIKRKEMEEKGQLSIFKKGGNLPSGAAYIPKSKVAKIYTEEGVFLGENLVGGVWYDNSKTKELIESARKRGLIK